MSDDIFNSNPANKSSVFKATRAIRQPALKHIGRSGFLSEPYIPRLMRYSIIVISVAVCFFVAWAALTTVTEVTRAEGEVVPTGYVQVVQHLEGGIVQEILVKEGQLVERGDVLMRLNGAGAAEDLAKNLAQLHALKTEQERLTAFLEGRSPDFSGTGVNEMDAEAQKRFFATMLDARAKEAEVIQSQIAQKQEAVRSLLTRKKTLQENLALAEESLAAMKKLLDQGLANRFRYLSQQEETNKVRGQLTEVDAEIAAARKGIVEYQQRLASLSANYHDQASKQLHEVHAEIAQLDEVVSKMRNRVERLEVRAPTRGLVKGLEVNTIGAVLGAGEKILEIVPMEAQMIVEAKISTTDVGHLRVGQPVQIKVHSYDFVRYGMVQGTLESISPTTFIDKFNKTFYRGRVLLQQPYVGKDPENNFILPGMTVEADIITGKKTVLQYLLKPIYVAQSLAMRER